MTLEDELKAKYLALIQQGVGVVVAAQRLGTSLPRMSLLRRQDPDYDAAVRAAIEKLRSARWRKTRFHSVPGMKPTTRSRSPLAFGKKKVPAYIAPFLAALAQGKSPTRAAEMVDLSYMTVLKWRREDPAFAAQWQEATQMGIERMEDEAHRRAVEGVKRPVFQGGEKVGEITEYSDSLLMFLLRGKRPEVYARPEATVNLKAEIKLTQEQARDRLQQLGLPLPFIETEFEVTDAGPEGDAGTRGD